MSSRLGCDHPEETFCKFIVDNKWRLAMGNKLTNYHCIKMSRDHTSKAKHFGRRQNFPARIIKILDDGRCIRTTKTLHTLPLFIINHPIHI